MDTQEQIVKNSPFESAGLFSRIFFVWNFPIFFDALKHDLKLSDLYKCPSWDNADMLSDRLQLYVERSVLSK